MRLAGHKRTLGCLHNMHGVSHFQAGGSRFTEYLSAFPDRGSGWEVGSFVSLDTSILVMALRKKNRPCLSMQHWHSLLVATSQRFSKAFSKNYEHKLDQTLAQALPSKNTQVKFGRGTWDAQELRQGQLHNKLMDQHVQFWPSKLVCEHYFSARDGSQCHCSRLSAKAITLSYTVVRI